MALAAGAATTVGNTITTAGLFTGTLGATISGAATSINASSNFATNINTGTSSGALALGGGSGTVAINSSDWDIDATGAMTGIGSITSDGTITATTFIGALTGNADTATTATNATNTVITNDITTAVAVYPTWVTAANGNMSQYTSSTVLSFVPSTGILTATAFVGDNITAIMSDLGVAAAEEMTIGYGGTSITAVISAVTDAIDLGAAGVNACVSGTSYVLANVVLGNNVMVSPLLDDAAWDAGSLTAFVESTGVIKIIYCADGTGADPASMTYRVTVLQF